ncbi:MAG: hypothetical protein AABX89_08525 [Candidatus Thermoplasmatota archaeon]
MARIDTEARTVVVAHSVVAEGTVELRAEQTGALDIPAGSKLVVVHRYEFEEASLARESFQFDLRAELAGESREATSTVRDRPLVVDDGKGAISVAFRAEAGRHRLHFWAASRYTPGPGKPPLERTLTGTLQLVATATAER